MTKTNERETKSNTKKGKKESGRNEASSNIRGEAPQKRPLPRARAKSETLKQKQRAVELLTAGAGPVEVAAQLGVDRKTVYRWAKGLNLAGKAKEMLDTAVERGRESLLKLVDSSTMVVRECLDCSAESKADASAMRVRLEAAKLVFDRVGLCAKQEVEVTNQSLVNLVEKFGGA
jgi:hypothetical protein